MVKKVVTAKFVAFDNSEHDTLEAATAHEAVGFLKQFANLKIEKIDAAWAGETEVGKKLASAFERLGTLLRDRRFDRGEKVPRGKRLTGEEKAALEASKTAAPETDKAA